MAANFWTSSHREQLLNREDIGYVHPSDQDLGFTTEEVKIVQIYLAHYIKTLAQQAKVRQRVVATAVCYFRRIYVTKSFAEYDPRVVAPTCLYLASKVEESTVQAKLLVFYIKKLCLFAVEIKDILEMEMRLLEALDFHLVIFHPYRPLVHLVNFAKMKDVMQMAWCMVNDTYMTSICLLYEPHMIALACIYLVCIIRDKDMRPFFENLRIDMNEIRDITMDMLDYYENYKGSFEDIANAALKKLPQRHA